LLKNNFRRGGEMDSTPKPTVNPSRRATTWLVAEYAMLAPRMDLINRYNNAVGAPGPAVAHVHADFIKGNMDDEELAAFVIFCNELIKASAGRPTNKD
jgi:hypothetical protein